VPQHRPAPSLRRQPHPPCTLHERHRPAARLLPEACPHSPFYWGRTRFELDGILRSFLTVIFIVLPILAVFPILIFGVTSETDTQTLLPVSAIVVPKLEERLLPEPCSLLSSSRAR